jgi:hypothetical protein
MVLLDDTKQSRMQKLQKKLTLCNAKMHVVSNPIKRAFHGLNKVIQY